MSGPVLQHIGLTKLELGPVEDTPSASHWRMATDEDGIAWLVLNRKGASANTLSAEVIGELEDRLKRIAADKPTALVIRSAKPGGFVAGADITEFRGLADSGTVAETLRRGHAVFDRLDSLPFPTVAVVHGYALGGGLELALACDHRIAVDGASFGFPEVMLGLHPGLGGTFRLTSLIDPVEAMTMMLTGKRAHTAKAKKLGIVDAVTEERHVRAAVGAAIAGKTHKDGAGFKKTAFSLHAARAYAARTMRLRTEEKAPREHYPAPHALIDLWERHGGDHEAMQKAEIDSFSHLLTSETAQNLIRVYFLREQLKALSDGSPDIAHVHVVGAGAMGAEIAAWSAIKGFTVSLFDVEIAPLGKALAAAAKLCDDTHLTAIEKRDALDRLMPDPRGRGAETADLVIEAAPENKELKAKIYSGIEPRMKAGAILASNTSSIPLDALMAKVASLSRFAGLHFFNPVSKMQLVEIVSHAGADETVLARLRAFTGAIGKLPAPVRTSPGFLVNRALTPYLLEAMMLMDEGVEKTVIDRVAERFGMPMGPVELADQVGLDICLDVAESLRGGLDKPLPDPPQWLRDKVDAADVGRKSGRGFYVWKDGKPQKDASETEPPPEMTDRLILPMLDACVECLRKSVVADEDVLDGAMIFATGFAPFRGGPMCYARQRGVDDVVRTLQDLARRHGPRFEPDDGWSDLE